MRQVTAVGLPFSLPRYLHLDLGKQTLRNVSRFRLHAHTLRVETASWQQHNACCEKCDMQAVQDEKHAIFHCSCIQMCTLRMRYADLFHDFPLTDKIFVNQTGAFYFAQIRTEDVFTFFQKQTNDTYRFISDAMDFFCMAEQPNHLAEGQIPL